MIRLMTSETLLYTEMVNTGAILHGDLDRHLLYSDMEKPLALQLGGDDPQALAECAKIAEARGYNEVNLNVGCPSDRVKKGSFGASMMARPAHVAECVSAMREACKIPVTVKHRTGIDNQDSWELLTNFVETVLSAGCDRLSVHARKAWLTGLSPKENRNVPPLQYDWIYRLKREYPDVHFEINGGIKSLDEAKRHLEQVDAVMIGRAAWDNPWIFSRADQDLFGKDKPDTTRREVVVQMAEYAERELSAGTMRHLGHIARPLLNLYMGVPGSKIWKRVLSTEAFRSDASPELFLRAMPSG
jgi:tRNA-dihydrouridine synthase A